VGEITESLIEGLFDNLDHESEYNVDEVVTCKYCGKKGLFWTPHPMRGFYLAEITYEKHVCRKVARVEDFSDIS
jgi:hypothetical protein